MCRCSLPPHQASSVIVSGLLGAGEKGPLVASWVKRCGARACVSRPPSYFFPEAGPPCPSEISQGPVAFQEAIRRVRPGPAFLHPWGGGEHKAKGGALCLGEPRGPGPGGWGGRGGAGAARPRGVTHRLPRAPGTATAGTAAAAAAKLRKRLGPCWAHRRLLRSPCQSRGRRRSCPGILASLSRRSLGEGRGKFYPFPPQTCSGEEIEKK